MLKESGLTKLMDQKEDPSKEVAQKVIENPQLLSVLLEGIFSSTTRLRFRSAKILRIISSKNPEMLYPHLDYFLELMESENNIIKWNALDIIANLTGVDKEHRFDEIFEKYYHLLQDDSMVTAAHVVDNSAKIASNRPDLQEKITAELLKVDKIPRDGECQNILSGKAILTFDSYFDEIEDKDAVISFVESKRDNPRNATKVKAEKFLKKNLE
jgi:hypothetical protein